MTAKSLLFLLVIFLPTSVLFAQSSVVEIKGQVTGETDKALSFATVTVVDAKNNTIEKVAADSNGRFIIRYPREHATRLVASYTGYKEYRQLLDTLPLNSFLPIQLYLSATDLQEVTVQAKQQLITVDGGTIIYNVAKSINAQGTDALEVLKQTPGVTVDNQGAIFLNGKQGALILLDGKPTYLSGKELSDLLRTMPSSSIKSIEVINTPNARYDATGSAGILNIKTTKSPVKGFTGTTTTGVTVGVTLKQNQDISFNYRKNKYTIYGSYNHFIGYFNYLYGSDRTQSNKDYSSHTDDIDKRAKFGSRLGMDYQLNKRNTIGVLVTANFIEGGGITYTKTDVRTAGSSHLEQTLQANNDYYMQSTSRYNINLNYKFEKENGTILNIDADYGFFNKENHNLQSNIYRDGQNALISQNLYRTLNEIDIDLSAFKVDYTTNIWKGVLETGGKYSSIRSGNSARFFHVLSSNDSLDNRRSNTFYFDERISSLYVNYKKNIGAWTLQAGLRLEKTIANGSLFYKTTTGDSTEQIDRTYTNVFPSGGISYKLNDANSFSVSFSRRLDRPAYQDLNPFVFLLDELSFWQGNPFLKPQYTNKTTLQYVYKSNTIAGLSYLHTSGFSARITDTLQSSKIVMTTRNLGIQNIVSFFITQNISPRKWWDISFNGSLNQVVNKLMIDQYRAMDLNQLAGRMNLQQRFKLPHSMVAEITAYYNTRRLLAANEVTKAMHQVDIGFQLPVLHNKGTLRLAVTDIYKGNKYYSEQNLQGLRLNTYGYYEARQLRLNFTYKFTSGTIKGPRTRNSALENENGRIK